LIKPPRGNVTVRQDGQAILTTGVDLDSLCRRRRSASHPPAGNAGAGRYHVAGRCTRTARRRFRIDTDVEFSSGGGPFWQRKRPPVRSRRRGRRGWSSHSDWRLMAAGFAAAYLRPATNCAPELGVEFLGCATGARRTPW